ncbi:hypothetical protein EV702DRAFT_1219909 [Suillus placidus]|uniref:AMP-dependent synthetase/ligase domain-containing protein n=1 Tax=Suillus placidus TaxID=48579 RepID=A0A9P6ZWT9_9AGAM|nr:hypothetical protein EV702DRAFT_1219909 [Suillus placidus]
MPSPTVMLFPVQQFLARWTNIRSYALQYSVSGLSSQSSITAREPHQDNHFLSQFNHVARHDSMWCSGRWLPAGIPTCHFPLSFISVLTSGTILRSGIQKHDLTSLKILFSGSAPLGAKLVSTKMKRMEGMGADCWVSNFSIGYGLTEISPTVFLLPVPDASSHIGTAGVLFPNLEVELLMKLKAKFTHTDIPGAGEVWVRGLTIMMALHISTSFKPVLSHVSHQGCLNNPTATTEAITPDRWFKTGDIGVRAKDGFFTIVDRKKELIKIRQGFQGEPTFNFLHSSRWAGVSAVTARQGRVIETESKEEATELPRIYNAFSPTFLTGSVFIHIRCPRLDFTACGTTQLSTSTRFRKGLAALLSLCSVVWLMRRIDSAAGMNLHRELRERAKTDVAEGQLKSRMKL